jgi:hypothetical protein
VYKIHKKNNLKIKKHLPGTRPAGAYRKSELTSKMPVHPLLRSPANIISEINTAKYYLYYFGTPK